MTVTKGTKGKLANLEAKEPDTKKNKKASKNDEENKEKKGLYVLFDTIISIAIKNDIVLRNFGPLPAFPHQRVWSRVSIIIGVLIYVWYSSKGGETSLAKQTEILQHRGQNFECDSDYLEEIKSFSGCVPKKCGRYVLDKLVTANEADILLRIAKKGIDSI